MFRLNGRVIFAALGCLVAVVALAACGSSSSSSSSEGASGAKSATLKIGGLMDLSGTCQGTGAPSQTGIQMAVDHYNALGGVTVGGTKYKLQTDFQDSGSENTKGVASMTKLVRDDGVKFVVGPICSGPNQPGLAPVAQKSGALFMAQFPPQLNTPTGAKQFPLLFNVAPPILAAGEAHASGVHALYPSAKRIYILLQNDATAHLMGGIGYVKYFQHLGDTTQIAYYDPTTTDFSGLLARAKAFHPDVLLYGWLEQPGLAILKQALQSDVAPEYYTTTGACCADALSRATGKPIDKPAGFLTYPRTLEYPTTPAVAQFAKDYKARVGRSLQPEDSFAVASYEMAQLVIEAIQQAGSTDPAKVASALGTGTYDTINGSGIKFSGGHQASSQTVDICSVKPVAHVSCRAISIPPPPGQYVPVSAG